MNRFSTPRNPGLGAQRSAAEQHQRMTATPSLSHLKPSDFKQLYEPSEDTFLFLDALEKDKEFIQSRSPSVCVEIGSGSGCVITFLGCLLRPHTAHLIATDVNPAAVVATAQTAANNNVRCDVVRTDLVSALASRLAGRIDVLLFNPPYVPTPNEEVGTCDLRAAWAGGANGRVVLDRLLPSIPGLLSPSGVFYMVAMRANKPVEIVEILQSHGFSGEIIMKRGAGVESLVILRFQRRKT